MHKTKLLLLIWFLFSVHTVFSGEISEIDIHPQAKLIRRDEAIVIECIGKEPILIRSAGMDLHDYEATNYFGEQCQFPIVLLVCENSLTFYHSASIEGNFLSARSSLTLSFNEAAPQFNALKGKKITEGPVYVIDENLRVIMDDKFINLVEKSTIDDGKNQTNNKKKCILF